MVKDKKHLHDSFSNVASYLYQTDQDEFNLGKMSLQCGRRNDALKFWTLWKSVGTEGLRRIVDHQFDLADYGRDYVRNHPDYTLYSHDETIAICFNYKDIPARVICTQLYEHAELLVGYGAFYALNNLATDTPYQFRVRSACSEGNSAWSTVKNFTTATATAGCDRPATISASNATASSATVAWATVNGAQSYRLRYRPVGTSQWTTINNITGTSRNLTGLQADTDYQVRVQTNCAGGKRSNGRTTFFSTLGNGGSDCTNNYEPNDYPQDATPTAPGVVNDKQSVLDSPYDYDYYTFENSAARPNIRIVLRDLPDDYDLYLYLDGYLVDWSENWYSQTEMITFNTDEIGTYEILVVGFDGAHDPDNCYELRVRTRANPFNINELVEKPAQRKTAAF